MLSTSYPPLYEVDGGGGGGAELVHGTQSLDY